MRTLTILLLLVSGMAYGQTINIKPVFKKSSFRIAPPPPDSLIFRTLIAISFAPTIPKDSTWTDKEIWEMLKINGHSCTEQEYDNMVRNFKFVPSKGQKVVHIRFQVNGRTTDYTFEEFRKILWP